MKKRGLAAYCATLGPIGFLSAPGTVATCVTVPFAYWLQLQTADQWTYALCIMVAIAVSAFLINKGLKQLHSPHQDPGEIVLDEVMGCLLVFWGITMDLQQVMIGVLLFRFLDIVKFGIIKRAERLSDAWGILADDLLAALITNGVLRLVF